MARTGPHPEPVSTEDAPPWLEDLRLWVALDLYAPSSELFLPGSQETTAPKDSGSSQGLPDWLEGWTLEGTPKAPQGVVTEAIENWLVDVELVPPPPAAEATKLMKGRRAPAPAAPSPVEPEVVLPLARAETAQPTSATPPSAPIPLQPLVEVEMVAPSPLVEVEMVVPLARAEPVEPGGVPGRGAHPAAIPIVPLVASKAPPAARMAPANRPPSKEMAVPVSDVEAPAAPKPVTARPVQEVLLLDKTIQETGFDPASGRILDPAKFRRWQKTKSSLSAESGATNASLFEVFRKARTAVENWVDEDDNRARILKGDMKEIKEQPALQEILKRYANYGNDMVEKLSRHLEFIVENRRKYYRATGSPV